MSKTERNRKHKKQDKRTPGQPEEIIELTEQELEWARGGRGSPAWGYIGETEKAVHQM